MNADTNLIGYMAQHLAALSVKGEWNQAHECFQPTVTRTEVSYATSCAELTQHDVAASLDVIGQLLLNYPAEDIGDAPHRLQQTGRLLRVLGGALELANEVAEWSADQLFRHNMLNASWAAAYRADSLSAIKERQERSAAHPVAAGVDAL